MVTLLLLLIVHGISLENSNSIGESFTGKSTDADFKLTVAFSSVLKVKELSSA